MSFNSGLIIQEEWLELILSGKKEWEIRGSATSKRGTIALIKSGSSQIIGTCEIDGCIGPLTLDDMLNNLEKHRTPQDELLKEGLPYKKTYAWVMKNPIKFITPISYQHPRGAIIWVDLNNSVRISETIKFPRERLVNEFIQSFSRDMKELGFEVFENKKNPDTQLVDFDIGKRINFNSQKDDINKIQQEGLVLSARASRKYFEKLQLINRSTQQSKEIIEECRNSETDKLFIDGKDIDIEKIKPVLKIVYRDNDFNEKEISFDRKENAYNRKLLKYCRLLQLVPTSNAPYRRIEALLFDEGQHNGKKLMGAICLSSTSYFMDLRDDYLEWKTIDSIAQRKEIREAGLKRIVQLSFCFALPPYNKLFIAKLLACASFSDVMINEYKRRYKNEYLGVLTSCVFGPKSKIYEGIEINHIDSRCKKNAFDYLGVINHLYTKNFSEATYEAAKHLVIHSNRYNPGDNKNNQLLKALSICNIPQKLIHINRIGYYLGTLSNDNLNILKKGQGDSQIKSIEFQNVVNYWYNIMLQNIDIKDLKATNSSDNILWEV